MITGSQKMLLKILRCALWGKDNIPMLKSEDFDQVMHEADQQAVSALVAERIIKSGTHLGDMSIIAQLLATVQRNKQISACVDTGVAQLARLLDANDIRYVVFKGQVAALNYPVPALRTSGDIDFYVAKDDFHRAADVIENTWKVKIYRAEGDRHWGFSHDGVKYELHYRAEMFGTKRHQLYFDNLVESDVNCGNRRVTIDGTSVRVFSKELELLHVFKHFFNHLLVEGVGLRQLCDLCVMLNAYEDIDRELLRHHLSELGYSRAFDATVGMGQRYLELPETAWTVASHDLEKYANRMMKEILTGGNFGRRNRKYHRIGMRKSLETAIAAFHHVCEYLLLTPSEVVALSHLRIKISMRNIQKRYKVCKPKHASK